MKGKLFEHVKKGLKLATLEKCVCGGGGGGGRVCVGRRVCV